MRLDLKKVFDQLSENAFILNVKFASDFTRNQLDMSFENFFNAFEKDPYKLIELMDAAVKKELKEKALGMLVTTKLSQEDEENFKPVTLDDLNQVIKDN